MTSADMLLLAGAAFAAFTGGVLITSSLGRMLEMRRSISRRLVAPLDRARTDLEASPSASLVHEDNSLAQFDRFVAPQAPEDHAAIRFRMLQAGRRNPSAVRRYYVEKIVFGVAGAVISGLYVTAFVSSAPPPMMLAAIVVGALFGFVAPALLLERAIQYRRQAIQRGFPDALDMLLVCLEAGIAIDQAITRVAKEIEPFNPTLADEFKLVIAEIRAGKERAQVFRDFAERAAIDDIAAFVTVLNQATEFGVSIADAIRVFAAEMRNKRAMRAEEQVNAIPMKLALGSILFTVPPVGVLLAGPSVLMIVRSFSGG